MGCHTWAYRRVKEKETLKNVINVCINSTEYFINNDKMASEFDSEDFLNQRLEDYRDYIEYAEAEQIDIEPDDIYYFDDNGDRVYYHLETWNQYVKRYKKVIKKLKDLYTAIDKSKTFDDALKLFITNFDIINDTSEHMCFRIINDNLYINILGKYNETFNFIEPFKEDNVKFFRVYGYPIDQPDEFYESSPTGKRPIGWTNAQSLIEFLVWYKNTEPGQALPYTLNDNNEVVEGYTEILYNNIRNFFTNFPENEVLVEFS